MGRRQIGAQAPQCVIILGHLNRSYVGRFIGIGEEPDAAAREGRIAPGIDDRSVQVGGELGAADLLAHMQQRLGGRG
jgi:hypothetical protein